MTTSTTPQKSNFNELFAQKAAEKAAQKMLADFVKQDKVQAKLAHMNTPEYQAEAKRPFTKEEAKAFFAQKEAADKSRTPEERKSSAEAFAQRKGFESAARRVSVVGEMTRNDRRYEAIPVDKLNQLADIRIAHKGDLTKKAYDNYVVGSKNGTPEKQLQSEFKAAEKSIEKEMVKFDRHFAEPKNLEAAISVADKEVLKTIEASKATREAEVKTAVKDSGMSL